MSASAWVLYPAAARAAAISGRLAAAAPGRWNPEGLRAIYAADSLALAILHLAVPAGGFGLLAGMRACLATFPASLCRRAGGDLPADWADRPAPRSTAVLGEVWAQERISAIMEVPSLLVPDGRTYVIFPSHPGFRRVRFGPPRPIAFAGPPGPER